MFLTCIYKLIYKTNTLEKISLYKVLYERLRSAIIKGEFAEGDLLPSENELCHIHQLTRPTVRQALAQLVNEGYLLKHQGKGSIVQQLDKGLKILSIEGTSASLKREKILSKILVPPVITDWPNDFFYAIEKENDSKNCIYLERLRSVDNRNVIYEKTYITNKDIPRFVHKKLQDKSLFDTLKKYYQIQITNGEQKIRAISADSKLASLLNISEGKALLMIQRKMRTNRKDFFLYSLIYCDTEHYYIHDIF